MEKLLRNIAGFIRIDLNELAEPDQRRVLVELSGILYILPWLFIAVVWLAAITDLETIGAV